MDGKGRGLYRRLDEALSELSLRENDRAAFFRGFRLGVGAVSKMNSGTQWEEAVDDLGDPVI